jgi:hypothetical protein
VRTAVCKCHLAACSATALPWRAPCLGHGAPKRGGIGCFRA